MSALREIYAKKNNIKIDFEKFNEEFQKNICFIFEILAFFY